MNFLYLHGFASSPQSRKARYFSEKIEALGGQCLVPDLNVPSFQTLSLSSQIELCLQCLAELEGPIIVIGSSMGGLLAALLEQHLRTINSASKIAALILLAPGFGITKRWRQIIGDEGMREWEQTGRRLFFHYKANQELPLHFAFTQELERYQTDDFKLDIPVLVFHGTDDQTVPVEHARQFAMFNQLTELVELVELDDGHELGNSLETIWQQSCNFINSLSTASDTKAIT